MELNFVLKLVSGLNIKEIIIVRMKTTIVDVIGMEETVVVIIMIITVRVLLVNV